MCMSRRWKAELVAYRICIQPSPSFMFLSLKSDPSLYDQSVQKLFNTLSRPQNPVAMKPCVETGCMSNQRKAGFVNDKFIVQSFWSGHGKILSNPRLVPKGAACPDF
jgi:hypothetical protein